MTKHGVMPGGCGGPPHRWIPKAKSAAPPLTGDQSGAVPLWKRVLIACRLSAPPPPARRPPSAL
jgi:hypothetical protein